MGTEADVTVVTSKPWFESISVWGAIIAILGTVAGFFNFAIGPDVQTQIVGGIVQVATGWSAKDWGAMLAGLGTLGGIIVGLVGRKQADQPVHFFAPYTIVTKAPLQDVPPKVAEDLTGQKVV